MGRLSIRKTRIACQRPGSLCVHVRYSDLLCEPIPDQTSMIGMIALCLRECIMMFHDKQEKVKSLVDHQGSRSNG